MTDTKPFKMTVEVQPTSLHWGYPSTPTQGAVDVYLWEAEPGEHVYGVKKVDIDTEDSYNDDDEWFACAVGDCMDPPVTLIRAPSWEDAYERFCELEADRGHYLIKDGDPDYSDEDGHWTDDGRRVDSQPFTCQGCALIRIEL